MPHESPSVPSPSHQRLLPTPAERVPDELGERLRAFCEASPGIRAGYVCLVEEQAGDEPPRERLSFAVELASPLRLPHEGRDLQLALAQRLVEEKLGIDGRIGIGFLAEAALPAWRKHAQLVFVRN